MARAKEDDNSNQSTRWFIQLYAAAQVIGLITVILTLTWCKKFLGGFGWADANARFNWHPFLMVLGFVYIYGNGMMLYRAFRFYPKPLLKLIHGAVNGTGLLFAFIGIIAAFSYHNEKGYPNMYSLHSWVGLGVVILFTIMLAGGVVAFLLPGTPVHVRAAVLPLHVYTGNALLALIVVAVISGIQEKAGFSKMQYSALPPEGMVLNFTGIGVVLFALIVGYITTLPQYKRRPLPQELAQSNNVAMAESSH